MTAKQCAQIAARLSPDLRDALRAWGKAGTERNIGCILDQKPRTSYTVDGHKIGPRQVDVLRKHALAETRVLWLCLTPHGAVVARWLAGIEAPPP